MSLETSQSYIYSYIIQYSGYAFSVGKRTVKIAIYFLEVDERIKTTLQYHEFLFWLLKLTGARMYSVE